MNPLAIRVADLSKEYHIGLTQRKHRTLRETIADAAMSPIRRTAALLSGEAKTAAEVGGTHWALRDVSFEVPQGHVIGLIGPNGAGKSTLLKILSRITEPTRGRAEIHGRVGSLLEVGSGFHPELTGRENIYLNGAILGMGRTEIDRKFDEIVAFAEIDKFLDTPVKHYSSGMYMRLAFSVAAHLEPEILLVDEVLSVGDMAFQKKCLGKMDQVHRSGRTVLFVSHNMAAVENLCSTTIVFDEGKIAFIGPSKEAVQLYLRRMADRAPLVEGSEEAGHRWANPTHRKRRAPENVITYTKIELRTPEKEPIQIVRSGEPLVIRLHYRAFRDAVRPIFGVEICSEIGTVISRVSTWVCGVEIPPLSRGAGFIDLCLESVNLSPGRYFLSAYLGAMGGVFYDSIDRWSALHIEETDFYRSGRMSDDRSVVMLIPCHWECGAAAGNAASEKWPVDDVGEPDEKGLLRL
jgi:lipopolysaccharide transport system ATP-binding protein